MHSNTRRGILQAAGTLGMGLVGTSLTEVLFEQKELGNPTYGCDLAPMAFDALTRAK
jgi:hypothetical protein